VRIALFYYYKTYEHCLQNKNETIIHSFKADSFIPEKIAADLIIFANTLYGTQVFEGVSRIH
jgi:hypothetical protein